jgi:hypothetical protein
LPATIEGLLSSLRDACKSQLADELTREIDQARADVALYQKSNPARAGHVIVGRIVGDGLDDASQVISQMPIHAEGYFVGAVGASGRPVGFRKQGYLPRDVTPTGASGSVEDVGELRLVPLTDATRAGLKGKLALDGTTRIAGATSKLIVLTQPINTPSGGYRPRVNDSREIALADSGEFSASGLSPFAYVIRFEAPGHVATYRSISPKPGEALDLGTITLEQPRKVSVSYREALSPPFTSASPGRQTVLGGGQFKAGNVPNYAYDLRFDQKNREIRFMIGYGPCRIADLGPGKLDDFLQVDPVSANFVSPGTVAPQPGHVYLLDQKAFKHWVLFEFELDPQPSE